VTVRAELDRVTASLDFDDGARHARSCRIEDGVRFAPHVGDVALLEIRDTARHLHQRRRVGREEVILLADAHEERAALPRADQTAALARGDHGDRVGALELGDRLPDGLEQIAAALGVPIRMHEVSDHFRVSLCPELVAARLQLLAQRFVILDDAVVDDGDFAAGQMRMRIVGRRRAVRGPARVRDARRGLEMQRIGLCGEVGHPCR